MKPYASYKPSGVPWLGDVPAHWQVEKVRFQARLRGEKAVGTNGARYVGMEHVLSKVGKFNPVVDGTQEEAESTVNVFSKGNVLFGKLRPYLAKCVVADTDGVCSSEFLVLSPSDEVVPAYLNATMLMQEFIDAVDASTYGAKMPRADWGFIGQQRLPLPPSDEQQAIADYLDAETARIDTLIHEKDELIGLLREARASVVDRAVQPHQTKAVPLKRYVTGIATGPFGSALHAEDYVSGGPYLINPTHIVDGKLVPDADVSLSDEAAKALSVYRFRAGDIVVGRRGEMGRCAVIPGDGDAYYCGTGCLMLFPDTSKVVPAYLSMVISSTPSKDWLSLESVGSTMENLNSGILGRLPCFVPSIDEQKSLLENVLAETAAYDSLRTYVQEEITLLKELRAATIADAVLGRVDVRKKT